MPRSRYRCVTPAAAAQIRAAYAVPGVTMRQVAAATGYSYGTVQRLLSAAGLPRTMGAVAGVLRVPEHEQGLMVAEYTGGAYVREIAAWHNRHHETVLNVLHAAGVTMRPRGRRRTEDAPAAKPATLRWAPERIDGEAVRLILQAHPLLHYEGYGLPERSLGTRTGRTAELERLRGRLVQVPLTRIRTAARWIDPLPRLRYARHGPTAARLKRIMQRHTGLYVTTGEFLAAALLVGVGVQPHRDGPIVNMAVSRRAVGDLERRTRNHPREGNP